MPGCPRPRRFGGAGAPQPVVYDAGHPPEFFDLVVVDGCHRSIYNVWRQVLEDFDAFLVGLTATPTGQTAGFLQGNLAQDYDSERAVADGVNVGFEVYRIETGVMVRGVWQPPPDPIEEAIRAIEALPDPESPTPGE